MYVGDELTNDVNQIHAVAPDGSAPAARLNDALVTGGDVGMR